MDDQEELDQLAEAEFQRLQRQLRSLQIELRSLLEEKVISLKKQSKLITVLQQEHEKLKSDILTLQHGTHAKKETESERMFEDISCTYQDKQKAFEQDKVNLWELEGHIKKIEKEINMLRKNEVTDSCYKENISKAQKDVVKLENRLDVVNKKCSDVLTENAKLRESIDHMLQDRAHFNDMWQSMVTQFNEGKKYIMDLIDQSTLAYDQREELCNKLQSLKDRNESDKMLHVQEMRELQRTLEHDAKLQQFYDVKGQRRLNTELEAREANKNLQQKEGFEKQLAEYNKIIQRVKTLSDETNIDKLAAQFTTQEEENFALFNYVNELSHEVEVLNEVVQQISDEIDKQKADQAENAFRRQTETIDHLESEKTKTLQKTDEALGIKNEFDSRLGQLLGGIEQIFRLTRCDDAPILSVLGAKNFLTVFNVKLFLGIIGKRINFITSNIGAEDSSRILAKKDRVPKFNVKDSVKIKN